MTAWASPDQRRSATDERPESEPEVAALAPALEAFVRWVPHSPPAVGE